MIGLNLGRNAKITLAVTLGADHANRRLVDESRIGADLEGKADGLGRPAGMAVDKNCVWVGLCSLFPIALPKG